MCGILGVSEINTNTLPILGPLSLLMEDRGKDSWGITDGQTTIKKLGQISTSYELPPSLNRCIIHTRAASAGAVTVANAHPFEFKSTDESKRVIGIHNGCLSNHRFLNTKLNRTFDVDSMHIFAHIAQDLPLKEIEGWGAIAWYEYDTENPDGYLCLARFNSENLHVVELPTGEFVFASTYSALERALCLAQRRVQTRYEIKPNTKYYIKPDAQGKLELYKCDTGKFEFGDATSTSQARHFRGSSSHFPNNSYDTWDEHNYIAHPSIQTSSSHTERRNSWDIDFESKKCLVYTCNAVLADTDNLFCKNCMRETDLSVLEILRIHAPEVLYAS